MPTSYQYSRPEAFGIDYENVYFDSQLNRNIEPEAVKKSTLTLEEYGSPNKMNSNSESCKDLHAMERN